jgi:hypothetical protein
MSCDSCQRPGITTRFTKTGQESMAERVQDPWLQKRRLTVACFCLFPCHRLQRVQLPNRRPCDRLSELVRCRARGESASYWSQLDGNGVLPTMYSTAKDVVRQEYRWQDTSPYAQHECLDCQPVLNFTRRAARQPEASAGTYGFEATPFFSSISLVPWALPHRVRPMAEPLFRPLKRAATKLCSSGCVDRASRLRHATAFMNMIGA